MHALTAIAEKTADLKPRQKARTDLPTPRLQ
jgi:hypothetical protein